MKIDKGNVHVVDLIHRLRRENKPIWKKTAEMLARPRRRKVEINLSKIDRYGKEGMVVLVPGKVLGDGRLTKKLTIAALAFSTSAKKVISETGGKMILIDDLLKGKTLPKDIILLS